MVIRLTFAVICVVIHLHCANAGRFFYLENSPIPARSDNPKGSSQYAPSGVLPSAFTSLVAPPATKNVPPSSSMWMKYAQDGQAVAYGYELTDSEENIRHDSPEPQYIRVPNPGYIIINRPSTPPKLPATGAGKNVLGASQNPSARVFGKAEELGKDASGIREVVVQAPGKHQNELSQAEYQPAGSADSDYQDYYEYEYDDTDFPDSNATPVQVTSISAKPAAEPSRSPAQSSTKEIIRNSVVISESTFTSTGTTPRPTARVEIAEPRVTTTTPRPTAASEPPRESKAIDSRPAYDVIRVGAAYATDVTPKMNPPSPPKGADYDEYYAYEDSSEFVDADEPLTSEITHSTTSTPIVTTEKPTTTTTTTTRRPTTTTTTTRKPTTPRTEPTSRATAEVPADEEYDYYEDEDAIPPALKHLHGDEYAFKPTAEDEQILSKITEKVPPSTTTTTSTTTAPTTTTTTTTTTPTTTTTTTTTTIPTTTTTTTPITTTTEAASTRISTQQRVSVTSSVGRRRRPRIKSTTPSTTTTTTEDDFAYDDDALLIDRAPEVKTTLEEVKVPPPEENLQILTAPSNTTQEQEPSSAAPKDIMRPTTYRPKLDLARYLAPTASQVATSPAVNVISKVQEIAKDGGFTAEEDDSSSWLGELLQFPHAIPDDSETVSSSTEGTSSTTADTIAESSSSGAELVVEEVTTPASTSTTTTASTVAPSRRVAIRGGRRKNARVRVAIRRQHEHEQDS